MWHLFLPPSQSRIVMSSMSVKLTLFTSAKVEGVDTEIRRPDRRRAAELDGVESEERGLAPPMVDILSKTS